MDRIHLATKAELRREARVLGIRYFYCIIAFETAMRQQNFAKQKLNRER